MPRHLRTLAAMFVAFAVLGFSSGAEADAVDECAALQPPIEEPPAPPLCSKLPSPLPILITQTPDEIQHANEREKSADDHDREDLKAQKDSASAASSQVWISFAALLLSGAAAYLVYCTYMETRRAADLASTTARQQLRAYVGVKNFNTSGLTIPATGPITVTADIQNFGTTPAYELEWDIDASVEAHPNTGAGFSPPVFTHAGKQTINPGEKLIIQCELAAEDQISSSGHACDVACRLYVYGKVQYKDAFGKQRETNFCMHTDENSSNPSLVIASKGNEAN